MMSKHLIALSITLPLLAAGCKEDEPKVAPIDQLPPATQTGRYTFGCLVNGKAFVPKNTNSISSFYQQDVLFIGASVENSTRDQNIEFVLENQIIREAKFILAPNYEKGVEFIDLSDAQTDVGICRYEYEDLLEGTLTITHFDDEDYIISGTFEFITATEGCDTIRVTDGRFDIPYIP